MKPLPLIPWRYTATVTITGDRWVRYRLDRRHGPCIPECSPSFYLTLKGAERAARKWVARNDRPQPRVIASL